MPITGLSSYLADVRADVHKLRKYIVYVGNEQQYNNTLEHLKLIPFLFINDYNERSGTVLIECEHNTYCDLLTMDNIVDVGFVTNY